MRRRSFPQLVVERLGWIDGPAAANGGTIVAVIRLRQIDATDRALAQFVHCGDDAGPAAALVAHLHASLMLASGLHQQFALARVVAARLLDVDVFAGRAAEDGGGSVPVIAGGNDEDIDLLVVEDAAEIGD